MELYVKKTQENVDYFGESDRRRLKLFVMLRLINIAAMYVIPCMLMSVQAVLSTAFV